MGEEERVMFRKDGTLCSASLVQRLGNKPAPQGKIMIGKAFIALATIIAVGLFVVGSYAIVSKTMAQNKKAVVEFQAQQDRETSQEQNLERGIEMLRHQK